MRGRYPIGLFQLCVLLIDMILLPCWASDAPSKSIGQQEIAVFDVPLGGSPQAVVDALKKSNIKLHGLISTNSYASKIGSLESRLLQGQLLSEPSDQQEAIKTLKEKVRRFSVKSEDGEMCLDPVYLSKTLGSEALINPLFSKDYAAYNSQFALYTSISDSGGISAEMLASGIHGIQVTFASLNQEEPIAFMISLEIRENQGLCKTLMSKYGKPKRYCVVPDSSVKLARGDMTTLVRETLANDTNAEFVAIKQSATEGIWHLGPTFQEFPTTDLFRPSDGLVDVREPFTLRTGVLYGEVDLLKQIYNAEIADGSTVAFVWRVGDTVIIWQGGVEFTDAPPRSGQLVYFEFPTLIGLQKAYTDVGADLMKYTEELKEKGKTKF